MIQVHLATFAFACLLGAAAVADLRTRRIPDGLNALTLGIGMAITYFGGGDVAGSLIGAAAGFGSLALIAMAYRAIRGRDGIGLGDAKLLGACGAWLGWIGLPFMVLIAACAGLSYVAYARLRGRHVDGAQMLAFGPFLAAGGFTVWCILAYA